MSSSHELEHKLYEINDQGELQLNFHPGQKQVWDSKKRFVFALAGTRGGKTAQTPWWLYREVMRTYTRGGKNDYLTVSPTVELFNNAFLPAMIEVFCEVLKIGYYWAAARTLELKCLDPLDDRYGQFYEGPNGRSSGLMWARIILRSAQSEGALESMTAKAAVLDECVAPETMIMTELGEIPISNIVNGRMPIKAWSFNTKTEAWELKSIRRWIKIKQKTPLLQVGNLRLTGDHKVWTKENGYIPIEKIAPLCYNAASKGDNHYVLQAVWKRASRSAEKVLQSQVFWDMACVAAGVARSDIEAPERAIQRPRSQESGFKTNEGILLGLVQSALGSDWRGAYQPLCQVAQATLSPDEEWKNLEARRQRQAKELATGKARRSLGERLGKRICGCNWEWVASPCIQDRCRGARVEDSYRSWKCCQPTQEGVVRSEWVDISSLLESYGRDLDGGVSSDGFVYNIEVEGNHNYIADNILVANCGMDGFTLEDWEAVQRRVSIGQARILGTTTPYNFGWLYSTVYQHWLDGDPDFDIINFPSYYNPSFDMAEYERARRTMPDWRFKLFYDGKFQAPSGLIYRDFDDSTMVVRDEFEVPKHWEHVVGVDFGGANTATVWLAFNSEDGRWYLYKETLMGHMPTPEHAAMAQAEAAGIPKLTAIGGAKSEGQYRDDWWYAGFYIEEPPVSNVEVGIARVISLIKSDRLRIFHSCQGILAEMKQYRRKLDSNNEPTEQIIDKNKFHRLDALRGAGSWIEDVPPGVETMTYDQLATKFEKEGRYAYA